MDKTTLRLLALATTEAIERSQANAENPST